MTKWKPKQICINVSQRNLDIIDLINAYKQEYHLSQADAVAQMLRTFTQINTQLLKLIEPSNV